MVSFFLLHHPFQHTHTQTHTQGLAHTSWSKERNSLQDGRTQARTSDDTSSYILALTPQNFQPSPVLRAGSPAPRTDPALFLSTASPWLQPAQILWLSASPQGFFPPFSAKANWLVTPSLMFSSFKGWKAESLASLHSLPCLLCALPPRC